MLFRRFKRPESIVDIDAMYRDLRQMVLTVDPADHDLPAVGPERVYGAVMELGYEEATATVVALTDGTTSLYATTGYGIIGGGAHEPVRAAGAAFIEAVAGTMDTLSSASEVDPPATTDVQFIALSYDRHRVGQVGENELRLGRSPLAPLYVAGQRVITELRLVDDAHRDRLRERQERRERRRSWRMM